VRHSQATINSTIDMVVRYGSCGTSHIVLYRLVDKTDTKSHHMTQITELFITLVKEGSHKSGNAVHKRRGVTCRTLSASTTAASFDLLILHTETIVTSFYMDSSLTSCTTFSTAIIPPPMARAATQSF